jgi:hypothetical protein
MSKHRYNPDARQIAIRLLSKIIIALSSLQAKIITGGNK